MLENEKNMAGVREENKYTKATENKGNNAWEQLVETGKVLEEHTRETVCIHSVNIVV